MNHDKYERPVSLFRWALAYEMVFPIVQFLIILQQILTASTSHYFWLYQLLAFREYRPFLFIILGHLFIAFLLWRRIVSIGALLMIIAAIISIIYLNIHLNPFDPGGSDIWVLFLFPTWGFIPLILGSPLLISELIRK